VIILIINLSDDVLPRIHHFLIFAVSCVCDIAVKWCDKLYFFTFSCGPLTIPQKKKLDAAHHKFQRRLLGITWKGKVRNEDIRNQTKLQRMDLIIKERRFRWLGHVLRMEETGYQSKPHNGKWTHAPEEPEGRDRTGLTLYLEI